MNTPDGYTAFREESGLHRRLLLQEELILDVTETLAAELENQDMLKKDLASKLGRTKGFVSQLLGGGRNLTLRTIADIADALDCRVSLSLRRRHSQAYKVVLKFPESRGTWDESEFRIDPKALASAANDSCAGAWDE